MKQIEGRRGRVREEAWLRRAVRKVGERFERQASVPVAGQSLANPMDRLAGGHTQQQLAAVRHAVVMVVTLRLFFDGRLGTVLIMAAEEPVRH